MIPTYINGKNWNNDFDKLSYMLNEINSNNCIVLGDCNVRIGDEQIIQSEIFYNNDKICVERHSKDQCINAKGKQWLEFYDNNDFVILNGRTEGDRGGNFTFLGAMGSSVNDLCCVNFALLSIVSKFTVIPEFYSDHCPIVLTINLQGRNENEDIVAMLPLLPKLVWQNKSKEYKDKLDSELINCKDLTKDPQNGISAMINIIKKVCGVQRFPKCLNKKQEWFDWQCAKERKKVFTLLNLYRNSSSLVIKKIYLNSKQNYKQICKTKKEKFIAGKIDKINVARDSKQF